MNNEIIPEVIEELTLANNVFKKSNNFIEEIEKEQEKSLSKEIPSKEVITDINKTQLALDLSLIATIKSLSYKIIKIEKFISSLEDRIYDPNIVENLSPTQLLQLYGQSRMIRESLLKQILELRKEIDIEKIQSEIEALHITEENKELTSLDEIINKILKDETFIDKAIKAQKRSEVED